LEKDGLWLLFFGHRNFFEMTEKNYVNSVKMAEIAD